MGFNSGFKGLTLCQSVKKSNATYFLHIHVTAMQYSSCQDEIMCAVVKDMCNTVKFSSAVLMCLVSSLMKTHISNCNVHTSIN